MNTSIIENYNADLADRLASTPLHYQCSGLSAVTTMDNIGGNWAYRPAPIFTIPVDARKLLMKKPISVKVSREDDLFFAENETLRLYGSGSTHLEAIEDFCKHLMYFFEHYKNTPDSKLMGESLKLKELYKDLFLEE